MMLLRTLNVAVIGAGVSGLAAARELLRENHRVVIFEKGARIGGTWAYDPRVETDPLSLEPTRNVVHSSLYHSLRTNLPRQVMSFSDYPFRTKEQGDSRTFPGHQEVLAFLNDFARDFGLVDLIRFGAEVIRVEGVDGGKEEWIVEWKTSETFETGKQVFDAMIVCNGHFTESRIAKIQGIDVWPGKQIHSHNYRIPEPFRDQVVVLIGSGPSAFDISIEISRVAKEVHLSSRSSEVKVGKIEDLDNVWQHSKVHCVYEDRKVAFDDGSSVFADIIFYCTGFNYHFPFLQTNGIVSVEDNRVGPLYQHIFPPHLAPSLSFIGIPNKASPFRLVELQSKWVAQVLSGKLLLPSKVAMTASVEELYKQMEETRTPQHYTHDLGLKQMEYMNWLASQVGLSPLDERIGKMYFKVVEMVLSRNFNFRDEWETISQSV